MYAHILKNAGLDNLGNRMLGHAKPNSITQVMIYNLGYDL